MYFKPVLVVTSFLYILICHHHFIAFVNGDNPPVAAQYQIGDAAINCGSKVNSTALDGREWIGDPPSKFLSGKSRSSTAAQMSFPIDPVPYKTSRISATEFRYTFEVNPGQKFIRLHFYPASYRGFENSVDFFTVKAGPFTLLRDFSASLAADISGMKYIVKEFCLNVEENKKLNIIFSPSLSAKSKGKIHAFVNGIEIISIPTGLYHTPDGDLGARIVGLNNRFYIVDNSTALDLIERLNIGGSSILPVEDFGMFRRWSEDASYLLESRVHRVSHLAKRIKYTNMPAFIAPPKLYQTSWKTERDTRANEMHKLTWKIPVDFGFGYLVRLHFCQFDVGTTTKGQREFSVVINNHITEAKANVIGWSGGIEIPVYMDYLVQVKGETEGRNCDLLISLESIDVLVFGLLNGVEIFKLSNLENSLATPNPTFPKRVLTHWNPKNQNVFLAFGQGNVSVTSMTILIILVNVVIFNLRQIWKEEFHPGKDTQTASTETSYRCFSFAEIKEATQNFNDAFVIGQGGFGKVYKGVIHGTSEVVAVKRLKSKSKQGAHEFWTEVETLSKLRHVHLVSLIGYCNESQKMILVYEYMPRGTLADNLYKNRRNRTDFIPLCWEQRLRICIGAARGLEYLHTGTEYGVIHRDVKDTNILLDEKFVAKISDFGLSKLEKTNQSKSYVSTRVKGTLGYLDPYYFRTHQLTRKTDVYAFGIVLLVVLCGRPAMDTENLGQQGLLFCFQECISKREIDEIIDPNLQGKVSFESLKIFVKSIESCLHDKPKERPTMAQVVVSLEDALKRQESTNFLVAENASAPWDAHWNREKPMKKNEPCYHFPIEDIRAATDNFSDGNVITQDAFRKVHVGFLQHMQREVCIYEFKEKVEEEDVKEMEMLSQLRHPNLLSLLGYCYHENEMYIVFDYVGNSTLSSNLYRSTEKSPMNWKRRLQICIGVAKGLDYLHNGTEKTVVHMDVRPATIMLDKNFVPKISNFGLSKVGHMGRWAQESTARLPGTLDHMCPEDISLGVQYLTEKSDVYSFGLVLLEVLCCRRSLETHGNNLRDSVRRSIRSKTLHQILNYLEGEAATACLAEYVRIAFSCLHVRATERPSMGVVVEKLEFALQLQENAEAAIHNKNGKGNDGFKLEDIYRQITKLAATKWKRPRLFFVCRQ